MPMHYTYFESDAGRFNVDEYKKNIRPENFENITEDIVNMFPESKFKIEYVYIVFQKMNPDFVEPPPKIVDCRDNDLPFKEIHFYEYNKDRYKGGEMTELPFLNVITPSEDEAERIFNYLETEYPYFLRSITIHEDGTSASS